MVRSQHLLVTLFLLVSGLVPTVGAQSPESAQEPVPASLKDVAWISGRWQGQALGGTFEETWNPPLGDSMVGMFRLVREDKAAFYELMTITQQGETLRLRLKHFGPRLKGWEAKDEALEFPLLAIQPGRVTFDGLEFVKRAHQRMTILVRSDSHPDQPLTFECQLAPAVIPSDSQSSPTTDLASPTIKGSEPPAPEKQ